MGSVMEEIATEADGIADEQRGIARAARAMQRRLDRGMPWSKVLDDEQPVHLLERMRSSSRRLMRLTSHLALTIARALTGEGESRRKVANRLGVTHQRVTAMLRTRPQADE